MTVNMNAKKGSQQRKTSRQLNNKLDLLLLLSCYVVAYKYLYIMVCVGEWVCVCVCACVADALVSGHATYKFLNPFKLAIFSMQFVERARNSTCA